MFRISLLIAALLCITTTNLFAQLHPAEGSKLHYRLIGFSFPDAKENNNYLVEIATGITSSDEFFKQHIVKSGNTKTGKIILEVPSFGGEYTWRVTDAATHKAVGDFHHFITLKSNNADTAFYRFQTVKKAQKYADAFVFNDGNKVLYSMDGEAVWFLPNMKGIVEDNSIIRDLKITPQNTITFLTYNLVYEINYDAEVLWRGPNSGAVSGDTSENYHHEITRLTNGHYMTLGHESMGWEWKHYADGDSAAEMTGKKAVRNPNGGLIKMALMGTVIEYDEKGKVVWSWKSSSYYKDEKIKQLQMLMGLKDSHENAFYFDEKNKMLYVSFKNTNQVLKIKYPEGKVVDVYDGLKLTSKVGTSNLSLFSEQHACKIAANGNLYLYNNNMANSYAPPQVLVLQQPAKPNGQLKKVWEYEYPNNTNKLIRERLTSGGNVIELPDHSMFVSSCVPYANVFIVSKDKQLLWDATLEKFDVIQKKWSPFPQYRASIITSRKRMEELIWTGAAHQK